MLKSLVQSILHEITAAFNPGEWNALIGKLKKTNGC